MKACFSWEAATIAGALGWKLQNLLNAATTVNAEAQQLKRRTKKT
jgi:hypothetical protein